MSKDHLNSLKNVGKNTLAYMLYLASLAGIAGLDYLAGHPFSVNAPADIAAETTETSSAVDAALDASAPKTDSKE